MASVTYGKHIMAHDLLSLRRGAQHWDLDKINLTLFPDERMDIGCAGCTDPIHQLNQSKS